jgi:hypothetical protein
VRGRLDCLEKTRRSVFEENQEEGMKKIIGVMAAGALLLGFAGQSMASFTNGDLIRVVYSPGSTYEYATDLGSLTSLENNASNSTTPITGSAFTGYAGTSYANLNVTYYVEGGATSADIAAPTSQAAPQQQSATSSLIGKMNNMATLYNTAADRIQSAPSYTAQVSQTNAHAYVQSMNGATAYVGTYGNFVPATTDVEGSLAPLAAGGSVAMYLYNFTSTDGWVSGGPTLAGSLVTNTDGTAFEILTVANGTEIVEGPAGSPVPVPPSMLLLGSGLLGLIGLRRKA